MRWLGSILSIYLTLFLVLVSRINKQNEITELRRDFPKLKKQRDELREEFILLDYEWQKLTSPSFLLEKLEEYPELYFPTKEEVVRLP